MKKLVNITIASLFAVMIFSGYQCSSTELTSAKLYIQQKNYQRALDALQKEVEKNPKSDEGYYLMGFLHGEKEEYNKMLEAFDKSLNISKKYEKDIEQNKKAYWANAFNKGVGFYSRASRSESEDSIKLNFEKAIEAFEQAILVQPDSAANYKNLGFVYLSLGDIDKAIMPFEKLISLDKGADGFKYLGEIYNAKGQNLQYKDSVESEKLFKKAVGILEEGRKLHPENMDILNDLAAAYIGANMTTEALVTFKQSVTKDPDNKFYRYNYGVLLLGTNKFEEAATEFEAALKIDPEYENGIYNLAVTYVKWGATLGKEADDKGVDMKEAKSKYELAMPYLEKYTSLKEDDMGSLELLAKVYAVLGKTDKANELFEKIDKMR